MSKSDEITQDVASHVIVNIIKKLKFCSECGAVFNTDIAQPDCEICKMRAEIKSITHQKER